jgi:hypothetical protein
MVVIVAKATFQLGHIFKSKKKGGATGSITFRFKCQFQGSVCNVDNVKGVISNKLQFQSPLKKQSYW